MKPGRVLVAGLVLGVWLAGVRDGRPADPLTNEDVVRMVMTWTPERAILERIAAATVDFDLDPETIRELREAGVGETILEGMRRRQAAMPRRDLPPAPVAAPVATGALEIVFASDPKSKQPAERTAVALAALPPRLERRGGQEVATVTDMAFAVLCVSPEHVPDHWDLRSPIAGAPRHEVILFRAGAARARVRGFDLIYLDRADVYRAELAAGAHRLLIAAAAKQAGPGTWRLLVSDETSVEVAASGVTRVTLRTRSAVSGSYLKGFDVDSEWRVVTVQPADAPATPAASGEEAA